MKYKFLSNIHEVFTTVFLNNDLAYLCEHVFMSYFY